MTNILQKREFITMQYRIIYGNYWMDGNLKPNILQSRLKEAERHKPLSSLQTTFTSH